MNKKTGRNELCPCGSKIKFKHCCLVKNSKAKSLGEHEKRMSLIGSYVNPSHTEKFKEFNRINKPNVKVEAEINKLFKTVLTKVKGFIYSGANLICDKTLRYFYQEYHNRLFNLGTNSFPTSFNVVDRLLRN